MSARGLFENVYAGGAGEQDRGGTKTLQSLDQIPAHPVRRVRIRRVHVHGTAAKVADPIEPTPTTMTS